MLFIEYRKNIQNPFHLKIKYFFTNYFIIFKPYRFFLKTYVPWVTTLCALSTYLPVSIKTYIYEYP